VVKSTWWPARTAAWADVLGNHRLAEALGGDEDDVAGVGEEVEMQDGLDGGAVDTLGPVPVEVAYGQEAAEAAAEQAAFEAAAGAFLLLEFGQVLEELGGAPAALGGERDDVIEVGGGVVQAEALEGVRQWGHRAAPVWARAG
jgi:hypothetical protein